MKTMFRPAPLALTIAAAMSAGCAFTAQSDSAATQTATKASVVEHYADLAYAGYEDALITARALDKATDKFLTNPTEANMKAAKEGGSRPPERHSSMCTAYFASASATTLSVERLAMFRLEYCRPPELRVHRDSRAPQGQT